jgi:hypothetical protein
MPPFFITRSIASFGAPPTHPPLGKQDVKNCSDKSMSLLAPSFSIRSCSKKAIVENA